jgi:hypothetical protein
MAVHVAEPQSFRVPARALAKPETVQNCPHCEAPLGEIPYGIVARLPSMAIGCGANSKPDEIGCGKSPGSQHARRSRVREIDRWKESGVRVAGLGAVCKDSGTWIAKHRPSVGARSLQRNSAIPALLGAREAQQRVRRCQSWNVQDHFVLVSFP